MEITSIVVDNFLENPDLVRESALSCDFKITGSYPGKRSLPAADDYCNYIKAKLESILNLKILEWETCVNPWTDEVEKMGTGRFQLCTETEVTWIHSDPCEWTAILYLTPNAVTNSGTAIFRHIKTGIYKQTKEESVYNSTPEEWEGITNIGNVYNRLAIFKGHLYHSSVIPGFGKDINDGRLTQVFFFRTTAKE